MPRKRLNLGVKQNYSREALQKAIDEVKEKRCTMRKASETYKVPLSTLCDNVNGKSQTNKIGAKPKLSLETEELLADYFAKLIQGGFAPTFNHVNKIIGDFLFKNNLQHLFKNGCPGRDWYYEFKKRWRAKFDNETVCSLETAQERPGVGTNCEVNTREKLLAFFSLVSKHYASFTNEPQHIWCLDEVSLALNRSDTKILHKRSSKATSKRMSQQSASNRGDEEEEKSFFTLVTCFNAAGDYLPPFIIFKSKTVTFGELKHKRLSGAQFATSPSGWMEKEQFVYWFREMFVENLMKKASTTSGTGTRPNLLFLESCAFNITIELLKLALENEINFLFIPQNCSNVPLNPAEVGLHRHVKIIWHKILDKYANKTHLKLINRQHLPYLLSKMMEKVFTKVNSQLVNKPNQIYFKGV
jgi:hypothetical protein